MKQDCASVRSRSDTINLKRYVAEWSRASRESARATSMRVEQPPTDENESGCDRRALTGDNFDLTSPWIWEVYLAAAFLRLDGLEITRPPAEFSAAKLSKTQFCLLEGLIKQNALHYDLVQFHIIPKLWWKCPSIKNFTTWGYGSIHHNGITPICQYSFHQNRNSHED